MFKKAARILPLIVLIPSAVLFGQNASPFQRASQPSSNVTSAPMQEQRFEFTGVIKLDETPLICVTDTASNRSYWMKVGQTVAGISLLRFDDETNQIGVRASGRESSLSLKKRTFDPSKFVATQPIVASAPLPTASLAETVPLTTKEKETDARMLVSDLLEIGMIQRKAYEKAKAEELEAKRKAAQQN
ncbi:MAG: hypothetical protein SynsKO_20460 [Synoicihabitans sp.]